MIIIPEHDAFQRIAQGLSLAMDGAKIMAVHRPDVAFMWLKMAEAFEVNRGAIYKLAEEAATRTLQSKGPLKS